MKRRTMVRVLGLAAWVYGALVIGSHAALSSSGRCTFRSGAVLRRRPRSIGPSPCCTPFFYPETVKAFTAITETEPGCAMAYWGLAMSIRQNPLIPVNIATLKQGREALEKGHGRRPGGRREKHIAMENRLVPMREILGELLLEVNEPAAALAEFEASLQRVPNLLPLLLRCRPSRRASRRSGASEGLLCAARRAC